MSAIYGIVDFTKEKVDLNSDKTFKSTYEKYRIDRYERIVDTNLLFGCGIQYITPYSIDENLPCYDQETNICLTADAVLSNHNELAHELGLVATVPDGKLIMAAYQCWGKKCIDHLIGSFAFAIYDTKANEVHLVSDHVGSRCLFYYYSNHRLYFSTIARPIQQLIHLTPSLNESWIVYCASVNTPILNHDDEDSPFNQILHVPCANWLTICADSVTREQYWNPVQTRKTLHLKNDESYQREFVSMMNTTIGSSINSSSEVGILLSSGLDSSSIACTAAPILAKNKKKLFSYTSIPVSDYKKDCSNFFITDESEGIKTICNRYSNITPRFSDYNGRNALNASDELLDILDLPTKSSNNTVWENELLKLAQSDHCKIVLNGQTGNTTVSYGNVLVYLNILLMRGRVISFTKEVNAISKNYHISRKEILRKYKSLFKQTVRYHLPFKLADDLSNNICIKQSYLTSSTLLKKIKKIYSNQKLTYIESKKDIYKTMYTPLVYSQIGEIQTKFGLKYGLLLKDPFTDKRMIEFCLSLPLRCYVGRGTERRLIRVYMKGIVPDEILGNIHHRGLQSADTNYRYLQDIEYYKQLIKDELDHSCFHQMLDQQRVDEFINSIHDLSAPAEKNNFYHLCNLYMIARFMDKSLT